MSLLLDFLRNEISILTISNSYHRKMIPLPTVRRPYYDDLFTSKREDTRNRPPFSLVGTKLL